MVELNGCKFLFVHRFCYLLQCQHFFKATFLIFFISHNLQNYTSLYVVRDLLRLSCSLNIVSLILTSTAENWRISGLYHCSTRALKLCMKMSFRNAKTNLYYQIVNITKQFHLKQYSNIATYPLIFFTINHLLCYF